MTKDVAFYVELAREVDGPVVELAIGNGRIAIPVAQATGGSVIGIDSSPAMLEQAVGTRRVEVRRRLDEHDRIVHLVPDLRAVVLARQLNGNVPTISR